VFISINIHLYEFFLALVSLTVPLEGEECTPCFSQKNTITNEVCKTFQNPNFKNTVKSSLYTFKKKNS